MSYQDIITIDPGMRGGRPCIRGMRITVYDIFSYLAARMTEKEILEDFPCLTAADILACYAFAANREGKATVDLRSQSSSPKVVFMRVGLPAPGVVRSRDVGI